MKHHLTRAQLEREYAAAITSNLRLLAVIDDLQMQLDSTHRLLLKSVQRSSRMSSCLSEVVPLAFASRPVLYTYDGKC